MSGLPCVPKCPSSAALCGTLQLASRPPNTWAPQGTWVEAGDPKGKLGTPKGPVAPPVVCQRRGPQRARSEHSPQSRPPSGTLLLLSMVTAISPWINKGG
ncbi:unnamed protein product [Gadus morhua 'NCC']